MAVVLDRERLEPTLPDPAAGSSGEVAVRRVRRQQPLHPAADVVGAVLSRDDMEVIRHQADGEKSQRDAMLGLVHEPKEPHVVVASGENGRAVVAPVDEVVVAVGQE
jgi:hypothetical protein